MLNSNLIIKLKSFNSNFWFTNFLQMLERLAYSIVVLQMAVYISQKDLVGGLHFDQQFKAWIFFFWAIIQNLTPVLIGSLADKYGRKNIFILSVIISIFGFCGIAFFRELFPFAISTIVLGFGLGLFKPTVQAMISQTMISEQKSLGWSINMMLINLAVFFAPPVAKFLENISWFWVFAGCAAIIFLNLLLILIYKDDNIRNYELPKNIFSNSINELMKPQILFFLIIMSGFTMIYMQFYETLPNFIYDWVDTSQLAYFLNLPDFMLMNTNRGQMIDFKWLYNLNSGLILLFVVIINYYLMRFSLFKSIIIGIALATFGLIISGISGIGSITVAGMIIYTFGEMITNPKISEFMSIQGDESRRATLMGLINVSFGIGLAGGSILGGYIYKHFGEKTGFALQYANEFFPNYSYKLTHTNVMQFLQNQTSMTQSELTSLLYNNYNPEFLWLPFLIIGISSIVAMYFYSKKYY